MEAVALPESDRCSETETGVLLDFSPSCATNNNWLNALILYFSKGGGARWRYPVETINDKIRSLRSKTDDDDQSGLCLQRWKGSLIKPAVRVVAVAETARESERKQ